MRPTDGNLQYELQLTTKFQTELSDTCKNLIDLLKSLDEPSENLRKAEEAIEKYRNNLYVEQLALLKLKDPNAVMQASTAEGREKQFEVWFDTPEMGQQLKEEVVQQQTKVTQIKNEIERQRQWLAALKIQAELQSSKLQILTAILQGEKYVNSIADPFATNPRP